MAKVESSVLPKGNLPFSVTDGDELTDSISTEAVSSEFKVPLISAVRCSDWDSFMRLILHCQLVVDRLRVDALFRFRLSAFC
ncbi:hypothetical protein C447_13602 [Halococcus hamelinensis 100A6]|uniref:Uncharacterized protein n=1 Tax=Halococcus hamelinensis 100A6 TaxID=1132509 RepID=M0LX22_9EURY|nr:hypothetical protein C447_13602 [Halococcus hamelinensis 100A6]